MKNKKIHGRVYLITNTINGKMYVGQTKQTIKNRFNGHITDSKNIKSKGYKTMPIVRAIRKYGEQNFTIDELDVAYNQQELNILEGSYMNKYKTLNKKIGYNLQSVDINGSYKHSDETKEKFRNAHLKPERKQIISEIGKNRRGKPYPNTSSRYVGVSKQGEKWLAYGQKNNQRVYIGTYNTEIEAAQARDITELEIINDEAILNLPELREDYLSGKIKPKKRIQWESHKKSNSKVVGVCYHISNKKWQVKLKGFKQKYFQTQEEAEIYALECLEIRKLKS